MNIKERLVRQSVQDKIEIGEIVRRAYNGKFGEVLRAYINGAVTKESLFNQTNIVHLQPLTSDRILGRIEAYTNVLIDLERMIQEAEELQQPIKDEEEDDQ